MLIYLSASFWNQEVHIAFKGRNFVDFGKNSDFTKVRFGVHENMAFSESKILEVKIEGWI